MIPILYESNETAFTSNGLGRLRDCIDFQVSEERNGVYEAVFQYPVDGANFEKIRPGRIVAARHDDSGDVQPFDIVAYSKPIDGIVTFTAVHVSYRLAGQVVYSRNINSLAAALNLLGNVSGTLFTFSADFTRSGYMAAADGVPRTARQMLGGIEGSILDTYGGELEFNRWQVILHRARGVTRPFTIRYGVNMLDYQDDTDYTETYNSAVPYWVGQDTVVVGSRVDSGAATYAGRRIVVPLDLTDKFEEKPTATQLENMAESVMNARQPSLPQQTIKVDFVRLQDLDNYAGFADLLQCNLCDTINVAFPRYNMTGAFKIVKTVYDVLAERYTAMELGTLSTTLAEALGISSGGGLVSSGGSSGGVADVMVNGASVVDPDGIAMVTNTAGDLSLNGDLTVGGHDSPIGTVKDGTRVSGAGSVGTSYSDVATVWLPKGTWHIDAFNSFNGGTAGKRSILLTTTAGATFDAGVGNGSAYANANTQIVVRSSLTVYVTASAGVTVHLRAKSSVAVNSPYGNITAVRIA